MRTPAKMHFAVALFAAYAMVLHAFIAPAMALPLTQGVICGHDGPHQPAPTGDTPDCCTALCGALAHHALTSPPPPVRSDLVRTSRAVIWWHDESDGLHGASLLSGSARGPPSVA